MSQIPNDPYIEYWHGRKVTYPAGVMCGPDNVVHPGPTYFHFDEEATGHWEYVGPSKFGGPWHFVYEETP